MIYAKMIFYSNIINQMEMILILIALSQKKPLILLKFNPIIIYVIILVKHAKWKEMKLIIIV